MTIERLSPEQLLGLDKFNVDEQEPHIVLDKVLCAACKTKPCLVTCSAVCYKLNAAGEIQFDHAGCLECGTCRVVCRHLGNGGVSKWVYPRSTFGVIYRYG